LPSSAASVSTFVVSWKEAADRNESVFSEALVMPRMMSSNWAVSPPPSLISSLTLWNSLRSTNWPGRNGVSPRWSTRMRLSIWRTISSMCLSLMSTPWDL